MPHALLTALKGRHSCGALISNGSAVYCVRTSLNWVLLRAIAPEKLKLAINSCFTGGGFRRFKLLLLIFWYEDEEPLPRKQAVILAPNWKRHGDLSDLVQFG